jgi:hypothetical protein
MYLKSSRINTQKQSVRSQRSTFSRKTRLRPDQGLAKHLAIYFWRQRLVLRHPLITEFLSQKVFISDIGRGMGEVKDIPPNVIDSLRRLAEWMTSAWKPQRSTAKKALAALWVVVSTWVPRGCQLAAANATSTYLLADELRCCILQSTLASRYLESIGLT